MTDGATSSEILYAVLVAMPQKKKLKKIEQS